MQQVRRQLKGGKNGTNADGNPTKQLTEPTQATCKKVWVHHISVLMKSTLGRPALTATG